ncbi:hypothetical protein NSK_007209 [Nannochloropsis salina CCMP1776]|uniref:VOC domain-containing protein n=1 Tax=Nannochloropsis salina CCMP1776 TaxID=1027361 RepID=A0A4D9CTW6_9STRA|nr:hypothetical protein NSK_007209 [Nannochloropsis salina CCMP1776]|eukprot:TFJ81487.1 hypothetical protein NSK_007209 [Nannochloropsis salina CCMP1776]
MSLRVWIAAGAACSLASLATAFLPPSLSCRAGTSTFPSLTVNRKALAAPLAATKKEKTAWDAEEQYEVLPEDTFILRPDIKDYAKLTEEEMAATESVGSTAPDQSHTTFVPNSHPFAHARLLNVVCRVADLEKTVKFYEALGMINLREKVTPEYSASVMGFGSEEYGQNVALQFVQDSSPVSLGDGYGGTTFLVPDVQKAVAKATGAGGKELKAVATVEFPATQVPDQDAQEVNTEVKAVVTDPDGYKVTFVQGESKDVLSSVTLRVFDTEKAVAFYSKLGMKVLKKRANVPAETSISTWVGYDDDHIYTMGFVHEKLKQPQFHMMRVPATTLLLNYEYDSQPVKTGNSLAQIVVGINKGVKTALDSIAAEGAKVLKEVSTEDGQDVAAVADVDGYTLTLVDMEEFNAQLA